MKEQSLEKITRILSTLTDHQVDCELGREYATINNSRGIPLVEIDVNEEFPHGPRYQATFFVSPKKFDLKDVQDYLERTNRFALCYRYGKEEEEEEEEEQ